MGRARWRDIKRRKMRAVRGSEAVTPTVKGSAGDVAGSGARLAVFSWGRRGTWPATKVPAPTLASAKPSDTRVSKAAMAAARDSWNRLARSRVVGSLAPAGTAPLSIRPRMAEYRAFDRGRRPAEPAPGPTNPANWSVNSGLELVLFRANRMAHAAPSFQGFKCRERCDPSPFPPMPSRSAPATRSSATMTAAATTRRRCSRSWMRGCSAMSPMCWKAASPFARRLCSGARTMFFTGMARRPAGC